MVLRRWIISTNPINRTDCIHDCYAQVRPPSPAPSTSTSTSTNHHLFANAFIAAICAAAVVFFLILTYYTVLVRRRCAEHVASGDDLPSAAAVSEADYHVWRICTVGLDESTINSIPMKPYITGSGGTAECSVCLGEFRDGELVRLLPACDHAFHAPCIDTWLRAHIRCPLCRAHVIVPTDFGSGGLASMHPYGNALISDQRVSGDLEDDRGREIRIDTITDSSLDRSENPIIRPFCELPGNRLQLVWRSNSIDSLPVRDLFLSIDRDGNCLEEKEQEYYYSDEDSGNEKKGKQGSSSKGDCQQICLALIGDCSSTVMEGL